MYCCKNEQITYKQLPHWDRLNISRRVTVGFGRQRRLLVQTASRGRQRLQLWTEWRVGCWTCRSFRGVLWSTAAATCSHTQKGHEGCLRIGTMRAWRQFQTSHRSWELVLIQHFHLCSSREQACTWGVLRNEPLLCSILNVLGAAFSEEQLCTDVECLNVLWFEYCMNIHICSSVFWICTTHTRLEAQQENVSFSSFLFVLVQQFESTSHCIYWDAQVYCSFPSHV